MDFLHQQVDNSHPDFTVEFLLDQLCNAQLGPEEKAAVSHAQSKPLDTGGFISDLYRFQVHFRDGRAPFSCIFKVPTTRKLSGEVKYDDETYMELVEWCFQVHNAECRFYSEVAPHLRSAPLPLPFRLPQLFASHPCPAKDCVSGGFLLMEDLCASQRPIAQVELAEGLSKGQVDSAILGLAHYHAICLASLPPGLVDSFHMEFNLNFEDQKLHISDRLFGMDDAREQFEAKRSELANLYLRAGSIQADQHKQFGIAPVITHGDFWSNNLFFECQEDGKRPGPKLDAIFDWQVVYSGTGVNDLLRVIFVGVDPEIRRPNMDGWLRLYTEELNGELEKLRVGGERSAELVRQMAAFHWGYEVCFQIFLLTNVLGGMGQGAGRQKLIRRMAALLEDCQGR